MIHKQVSIPPCFYLSSINKIYKFYIRLTKKKILGPRSQYYILFLNQFWINFKNLFLWIICIIHWTNVMS